MSEETAFPIDADGVLRLCERVRVSEATAFRDACRALLEAHGDVRIDCTRTVFLDTSALQVVLALKRALDQRGRTLKLEGAGAELAGWLRLAGLAEIASLST